MILEFSQQILEKSSIIKFH